MAILLAKWMVLINISLILRKMMGNTMTQYLFLLVLFTKMYPKLSMQVGLIKCAKYLSIRFDCCTLWLGYEHGHNLGYNDGFDNIKTNLRFFAKYDKDKFTIEEPRVGGFQKVCVLKNLIPRPTVPAAHE